MRTDPRRACVNEEERLLWALIHDGIAHPLMALTLFSRWAIRFHDWTSSKAWPRKTYQRGALVITANQEVAFKESGRLHAARIPHVIRSIPLGDRTFRYEVERLIL